MRDRLGHRPGGDGVSAATCCTPLLGGAGSFRGEIGRNAAAGDADGDGASNLEEFLAGTDPNDPESSPVPAAMPWIELLLLSD